MSDLYGHLIEDGESRVFHPLACKKKDDGRYVLEVDTELDLGSANVYISNIKVGSTNQTSTNSRYLKTEDDGTVIVKSKIWDGLNTVDVLDLDYKRLAVDANIANELFVFDEDTRNLQEGKQFNFSNVFYSVVKNETIEFLIKVPAGYKVLIYHEINSSLSGNVIVYENPTFTDEGTQIYARNFNRSYSDVHSTLIYNSPAITTNGTKLSEELIPSGKTGTSTKGLTPWILNPNSNYYWVLTSSENDNNMGIKFSFAEIPVSP